MKMNDGTKVGDKENKPMNDMKQFTVSAARPLPVILLADVSGSMAAEGKIEAMNQSVREMLATFGESDDLRAEVHVAIITFGGDARLHTALQPASAIQWTDMVANGGTPMGRAMVLAADLIEDKEAIPSRAYRPVVVLVSDGQPTDAWQEGLQRLTSGRAGKADRMGLAIGADADTEMLKKFLGDPEKPLFVAADARRIRDFFQFLTLSISVRSRSANPNEVPAMQDPFHLDRL
jgi:uncharacterized protein YegL